MARRVLDLDFDEINRWIELRNKGSKVLDRSLLPRIGFIIDNVAVGFIYFTDSLFGIIDCYISNPETDSKIRDEALDVITEALIKCAKTHGCKIIKCDTKLENIKKRAMNHGFKSTGMHESFAMEI